MRTDTGAIFKDPNAVKFDLHENKYIVVPAEKKPTITVFLYRSHHIECLIKELCIDNSLVNPKYTLMIFSKEKCKTIIVLYCIPLEFHQKMTNWVFLNSLPFIQLLSTLN